MKMKKMVLVGFLAVFLSVLGMFATVNAAPETGASASTKFHFASRSEVIGYWKMIQMPEETRQKINQIDPWPLPYQWFIFYDDGRYNSAQSSSGSQVTVGDLDRFFSGKENKSRFEFLENHGYFRITQPGEISQYWAITVCDEAHDFRGSHFEAGDLLMMLVNKNGEQVYYRHVRRM